MRDAKNTAYNILSMLFAVYQFNFAVGLPVSLIELVPGTLLKFTAILSPRVLPVAALGSGTALGISGSAMSIPVRLSLLAGGIYLLISSLLAIPFVRRKFNSGTRYHLSGRHGLWIGLLCIPVNIIIIIVMLGYVYVP